MGTTESKEVSADTTGNINNIQIIGEDTEQYYYCSELLLSAITILKLIELLYIIYSNHIRKIKKKYISGIQKV